MVDPTGSPALGAGTHFPGPTDPTALHVSSDQAALALYQEPDIAPVSFATGNFAIGMEWVVPTFLVTLPGFLLIGVGLAQAIGGFVWLPLVRRVLSGDGRRSPKRPDNGIR